MSVIAYTVVKVIFCHWYRLDKTNDRLNEIFLLAVTNGSWTSLTC